MQSQHLRAQLQSTIAVANPVRLPDPEEIEKLRTEWRREQRAQEHEQNQRRAELVGLRSQLHAAQQKLDSETRGRRMDAARTSLQIRSLETQLEVALRTASSLTDTDIARRNLWLRWSAVFASAAVIGAATIITSQMLSQPPRVAAPAARPVAVTAPPLNARPQPAVTPQTFSRSLSRLSQALSMISDDPEKVLRAIRSKDSKVCSFQWHNGQPALVYSAGGPGGSISSSLDSCAQAVERYRSP